MKCLGEESLGGISCRSTAHRGLAQPTQGLRSLPCPFHMGGPVKVPWSHFQGCGYRAFYIHLLIWQVSIKFLLNVRHCYRYWGHMSKRASCLLKCSLPSSGNWGGRPQFYSIHIYKGPSEVITIGHIYAGGQALTRWISGRRMFQIEGLASAQTYGTRIVWEPHRGSHASQNRMWGGGR